MTLFFVSLHVVLSQRKCIKKTMIITQQGHKHVILGSKRVIPGEFDILMEAKVKFPTPRHLLNVNLPPLE